MILVNYLKIFIIYFYQNGKSLLLLGDAFAKEGDLFNAKVTWNTIIENFSDKAILADAKKRLKDNNLDAPEKPEKPQVKPENKKK